MIGVAAAMMGPLPLFNIPNALFVTVLAMTVSGFF